MTPADALIALFSQNPCTQLLTGQLKTVWLEEREAGNQIRVRESATNQINTLPQTAYLPFNQLRDFLLAALNGSQTLDCTVNGIEFWVTTATVVNGFEHIVTRRDPTKNQPFVSSINVTIAQSNSSSNSSRFQ